MAATKQLAKPLAPDFGPMADELGALIREMAPFAQKLSRIEALKKALREACTAKPTEEWTITGKKFVAALGPKANERAINFTQLVKLIGAKAFLIFATCTLGKLEENVSPVIVAAVVSWGNIGSRSLKTFEKGNTP